MSATPRAARCSKINSEEDAIREVRFAATRARKRRLFNVADGLDKAAIILERGYTLRTKLKVRPSASAAA